MKTPFIKVRGLGLHRDNKRDRQAIQRSLAQLDELSQASQDMQDMRDCYDSLLSAAAGTTNNAYEFSESLQEMGDCLLAKTALSDDEDSGRVLLMLGKVQFDIQKLIDNYRSHISQTITVPSESLLNELRVVEEMKKQCDEKRMTYEVMKKQYEKGRSKSSKGEYVSSRQLQSARDEFDEEATLFILRMKSLKRGQSRSLLTQAARHHAAQLDNEDLTFPKIGSVNSTQTNTYRRTFLNTGSKSAPLSAETTFDPNERYRPRKLNTYVLPTPLEKSSAPSRTETQHPQQIPPTNTNMWHSLPLEQKNYENIFKKENNSRPIVSNDSKPTPVAEAPSSVQLDSGPASTSKKIKRDVFSGPLMGKIKRDAFSGPLIGGFQSKPLLSTSGSIGSTTNHLPSSAPPFRTTLTQPSEVHVSSVPLPMIRELHELPRPPPANIASNKTSKVGFSAPLVAYKGDIDDSAAAYTLPLPSSKSQRETWKLRGDESPPLSPITFRNF
ncbi:Arfaptin homology (AH) domain/BAR domain-containing protein [Cynara cardunculus var. scolymus]|uniref:Arfaptin homology (AH) domain/BAR domain-containing protein n=1 Tax=Cynara cardunculus var. scolymus TaxID=59895 RepID=A0A103XRV4_CYNCS|nr:Arfaptin homology (AH) domain/BAR domain-containing protein [Cynara cardunculus var. scolymus]